MKDILKLLDKKNNNAENSLVHEIFRVNNSSHKRKLEQLLEENPLIEVVDTINIQLQDLVKKKFPSRALSDVEMEKEIEIHIGVTSIDEYGVWVYFPWRNTLVHMLDEEEFLGVRTVRNLYKITQNEQELLYSKRVGIIGLSVGQSVCLSLAMERCAGEFRIADFDKLELSNMNRIRSGVQNIGLSKNSIVQREIAEIDPFLKVTCYDEGINKSNIDTFLLDNGKLDLLIEECDSIEIKILARERCKELGIPVLMDTSDRAMIDIERFDLDPEYPILHGLVPANTSFDFLSTLRTTEEKLPYVLPIVGADSLSARMKASAVEVGQTITTWPQLGSDVALGGAVITHIARRILLGERIPSGRKWVDLEALIVSDQNTKLPIVTLEDDPELTEKDLEVFISQLSLSTRLPLENELITKLVTDANLATSPGNNQRWKWAYKNGNLLLFLDKKEEKGFSDNFSFGSWIGLGAALENLRLSAAQHGWEAKIDLSNSSNTYQLAAIVHFEKTIDKSISDLKLASFIDTRSTNRTAPPRTAIAAEKLDALKNMTSHAEIKLDLITLPEDINRIGQLVLKGDRIRLLNKWGHQDFFKHEIRWNKEESEQKRDGLDLSLFELTAQDMAGLQLLKDERAVEFLQNMNLGSGLEKFSKWPIKSASALGLVSLPDYSKENLLHAGMEIERIWLKATELELGLHPMTVLQMLFSYLDSDKNKYLQGQQLLEVLKIKAEFDSILPTLKNRKSVFLFRILGVNEIKGRSVRKAVTDKLKFV